MLETPRRGQLVRVRQRTYLVEEQPGALAETAAVLRLACVDDDAQGQRLSVVWGAEVDAEVLKVEQSALAEVPHPDDRRTFSAYLHALRWGCVTSTDPTLFQAPLRAGIVPKSYQLEPLRKALALPRVNLFVADDVGLGKTIEAGLVLQEMILRQRVSRVVVVCPASVVLQWRDELSQRFGLVFTVLDKAYINQKRRERGFGINPWTTHRHFIISHSLIRDEGYLVGLRDWLGEFCAGSLLILDEAHVAAPSSQSKYAIDSQTTLAIRDIARRFEHRLFLSATPHNGHSNSFSALLEILDPQRFTRGVPVRGSSALRPVMVRRLKGELRKHIDAQLPERIVVPERLEETAAEAPELVIAERLAHYADLLEVHLRAARPKEQAAAMLVSLALQKRLLSSVDAFARTLQVHRASLDRAAARDAPVQVELDLDPDEAESEGNEAVAQATGVAGLADAPRVQQVLEEMASLAEEQRHKPDAKVRRLLAWIRQHQCPDLPALGKKAKVAAPWTARRVIIFTEYADTKEYLLSQLEAALQCTDRAEDRVLSLHGGMDEEAREAVKEAFNHADHPVRILVATDAAREGINLQAQCADLFHFDLPWNPARLEQRNGRIDRLLSCEDTVRCHYFQYAHRPEDDVLAALVQKTERIRKELGSLADVISEKVSLRFKDGIRRKEVKALADALAAPEPAANATAAEELESDAELAKQLTELDQLYDKAKTHLDLSAEQLRDVVNLGFTLSGLPQMTPRLAPPDSFDVPPLERVAGVDGTWREILDLLRAPRTRKMKLPEWRATCPPRPVSFEPSTTLSSKTVQLHLQHRLTQRALAPFRTQGFGEDKLSRVTVVVDRQHARKSVLVVARLSLYGQGASRLHEELLVTGAYWQEGAGAGHLTPFSENEEAQLFATLSASLAAGSHMPKDHIVQMLMRSARADEEALWPAATELARKRRKDAQSLLKRRATAEANEMERILTAQRKSILKEIERRAPKAAPAVEQLGLFHLTTEADQKRQFEADTRHMNERIKGVDLELVTEPERIREQYEVKYHRLERVGLVYLWPATS